MISTHTKENMSRSAAFCWVFLSYALALGAAWSTLQLMHESDPLVATAVADVVGTCVIFAFSYVFDNSSFYDPYWSILPVPIALHWLSLDAADHGDPMRQWIMFALVAFWSIRLTVNWIRGWTGIQHEDFRYVDFRYSCGRLYWLVSFSGIHMFPTALVYVSCFGPYVAITEAGVPFGAWDIAAALVTFMAVMIELISDEQLRRFRLARTDPGETLETGLWKYSRHPNYFGELLFWWGLWLFSFSVNPNAWWTLIGPLGMTWLFIFISVPMMDKRALKRKPDYARVIKMRPALIPFFPRSAPVDKRQ